MASLAGDRPFWGDLSTTIDTSLFERDTGRLCGLISHTCSNYGLALSIIEETLPIFLDCGISSAARLGLCSLRGFSALYVQSLRVAEPSNPSPSGTFSESFRSVAHTQNDLWVRHPNTHQTHNVLSTSWVLQRTSPPTHSLLDYDSQTGSAQKSSKSTACNVSSICPQSRRAFYPLIGWVAGGFVTTNMFPLQ